MASVPQLLLDTLMELVDQELKTFHWYLYSQVLEGIAHISKSLVEGVDRPGTVDLLVKTYGSDGAVTVTIDILRRMKLIAWAETLKNNYNKGKMFLKIQELVKRICLASSQRYLVFVFYQFQQI